MIAAAVLLAAIYPIPLCNLIASSCALDFRKRFALSSYDATLKRSGVTPPWLPTNGRDCQSRRADMLRRSAIALT